MALNGLFCASSVPEGVTKGGSLWHKEGPKAVMAQCNKCSI